VEPLNILEFVMTKVFGVPSTILVPAPDKGRFCAREHFVVDTGINAPVRISHLSNSFRKRFLDGEGKVELVEKAIVLSYVKLRAPSVDGVIFAEIGCEDDAESPLWSAYSLMSKQPHGEVGGEGEEDTLLVAKITTIGAGNNFYNRDQFNELACVQITWHPNGWHVSCWDIVTERSKWNEWEFGNQIFFPRPQVAHNVALLERNLPAAKFGS
jgi:hypothetical protein